MREGRLIADDSPEGLLRATGTETAGDAFLALIASDSAPSPATPQSRGQHLRASAGRAHRAKP